MKTLILGGVRSGKSRLGEQLASDSGLPVIYIATATADDTEMQMRIESHRESRPDHWTVIEEPIYLAKALKNADSKSQCILVDCLTLWLTNLLTTEDENLLESEIAALLETLSSLSGQLIMVSNETNMGIVPMGELSRRYCDEAGRLHQLLAQTCDRVIFTVAGLPQILKGEPL
ncbi:MAG: bifunctional adenosylcobinamide kinase/adenosylcobinamide-phosphate guanylyltransferase [Gammaproteobacteria bacterium]|nr:bifunctional adenosylcobinamide kinase/adenosylcobinamide-phosphate guanylyltransferase [Gammaproteobacteria bacterium]